MPRTALQCKQSEYNYPSPGRRCTKKNTSLPFFSAVKFSPLSLPPPANARIPLDSHCGDVLPNMTANQDSAQTEALVAWSENAVMHHEMHHSSKLRERHTSSQTLYHSALAKCNLNARMEHWDALLSQVQIRSGIRDICQLSCQNENQNQLNWPSMLTCTRDLTVLVSRCIVYLHAVLKTNVVRCKYRHTTLRTISWHKHIGVIYRQIGLKIDNNNKHTVSLCCTGWFVTERAVVRLCCAA